MNGFNTPYFQLRRKILFDYLEQYPDTKNQTLARVIYKYHPEFFNNVEHARNMIRLYRGKKGETQKRILTITKYYKNV